METAEGTEYNVLSFPYAVEVKYSHC